MLYIDLLLSLALFIMGIVFAATRRHRKNIWIIVLALLFFPISLFTYYFHDYDITLFGHVTILKLVIYPLLKIFLIFALVRYIVLRKRRSG